MKAICRAASVILVAAAFAGSSSASRAQTTDYPSKPVRILVGASPGGTTDTMARAVAHELSAALGQPVIVENKPGAGGNLAADTVAKASSDGHTLLVSFTSHTINATLYPNLPFDPIADFTPITMIATVPSMLVGNVRLPDQTLEQLIASAKSKPDKLTIAIGGIGSSLHLAGEQLKMMSGIKLLNVPYKGSTPAMTDVLAGHVDLMFISMVTGAAQVKAGKLKAFGVTSAKRLQAFPDLPAIGEVVPGFESVAWFGVFAPANLPAPIAAKLNTAIAESLKGAKLRQQLELEGASAVGNSQAEFAAFVRDDVKRWAPIVKQSGATPD
ncbi:tripartite tricarboxylate transporter substrate binding protein [Bradyrhizobium sp. LHD-71]|uniref:tripartite tricarboxylate transporter substrate binding protein n=1 Tax=Bradyrhizobium sp. LHD-71 TaxID=3072141 RepID=UPI00280D5449|nr:tripartite tricarboxylate transporter substrate binding protein [Bradyrhizobium sp. LHD-71]MDQ8732006.1 tripartite tricarboxylate transporter substrate binding protein [Bradyrhizobium sp. LHD-71]